MLCLDNDADSLAALEGLLTRWGHTVTAATDPAALANVSAPDLMIMDYRLDGGLTGDEAAATLTARWKAHPPAILLTAEDTPETKAAAERMGATRMIKPTSPPALRAMIGSLLAKAET